MQNFLRLFILAISAALSGQAIGQAVTKYPAVRGGTVNQQVFSTNSSTSSSTVLSAADISGGSQEKTLSLTGIVTVASNVQLPLVTALVTALGNPSIGQTYKLRIMNSGGSASGVWTVTTNTGWTLNGTMMIGVGTYRDFYVILTSLTAATLQDIGAGSLV